MEINVRNVNEALSHAIWRLRSSKYPVESTRNGDVLAFPEPVITTYRYPQERMLFSNLRDANPIFHILESVWMLAGRRDVEFLRKFNSKIGQFSDDGKSFNAAYGYRWRHHFGHDQLVDIIKLLRKDPDTRQAVIQMWAVEDLTKHTKDKACNTQVMFDCRGGKLNMTVMNRSNDLWWGAYGANAVHFSFLQEFVAHSVGIRLGVYRQVSNNLHLYLDPKVYDGRKIIEQVNLLDECDLYSQALVRPSPIMAGNNYRSFLVDCAEFCDEPFNENKVYANEFFNHVAHPLAMISHTRNRHIGDGREWAKRIISEDVKRAALDWIDRRERAKQA